MTKSDLIIIGSGPAGLTAAIYTSRAKIDTLLFTGKEIGGQLMYTSELENFPGFPQSIIGPKFMMGMKEQAVSFGTNMVEKEITKVDFSSHPFKVFSGEEEFSAKAVIISTGASSIMPGIAGEKKFFGRGVSTCAVCDSAFYKDKTVFVIGGGDSAMEDALALAKFTNKVTIVHRKAEFRASKIMQDRVLSNKNIKIFWESEITEIRGTDKVEEVVLKKRGVVEIKKADGVFLAIGHKPVSSLFKDQLKIDEKGYLVTRKSFSKHGLQLAQSSLDENGLLKFPSMTSTEGIFGAGDVVDVRYKQAITAAGMGCQAALDAEKWLEHLKE